MSTITFVESVLTTFHPQTCWSCSASFALNGRHHDQRREDHGTFWCPVCGTPAIFSGEKPTERAERLRRVAEASLIAERARHDQTRSEKKAVERRLSSTKGVITRVKNRVSKGVCPCCNRHFANLHRHMENQHPEFATPSPE